MAEREPFRRQNDDVELRYCADCACCYTGLCPTHEYAARPVRLEPGAAGFKLPKTTPA